MVYGVEAIMPNNIIHDFACIAVYIEKDVEATRHKDLDLLGEERELSLLRSVIHQQNLCHYHSRKVRHCFLGSRPRALLVQSKDDTYKLSHRLGWAFRCQQISIQ